MPLTIREKADVVGTLRDVSIVLMETLARWVPTTPEMEVKTLFGRHIWDLAQHADWYGRRAAELRAALHYRRPPPPAYAEALALVAEAEATGDRLAAFYDVGLPDLVARCAAFERELDGLLDDPTMRILERVRLDAKRMLEAAREVRHERDDVPAPGAERLDRLRAAFTTEAWVDFRPAPAQAAEVLA